MSSRFKPLLPNNSETPENAAQAFRPKVLSQAVSQPAFQPLITKSQSESSEKPDGNPASPGSVKKHGKPTIALERQDGQIIGIRVECSCGEVIELSCHYANPADAASSDNPA